MCRCPLQLLIQLLDPEPSLLLFSVDFCSPSAESAPECPLVLASGQAPGSFRMCLYQVTAKPTVDKRKFKRPESMPLLEGRPQASPVMERSPTLPECSIVTYLEEQVYLTSALQTLK